MFGNLTFTSWANTTIGGEDYYAASISNGTAVIIRKTMVDNGSSMQDAFTQNIYTSATNPFNLNNWDDDPNGQTFSAVKDDYVSWVNQ